MPGGDDNPPLIRVIGDAVDRAANANQGAAVPPPAKGGGAQGGPASSDPGDAPGTFYLYVDAAGTEHIVDSLALVPKAARKTAKKWIMPADHDQAPIDDQISEGLSSIAKSVQTVATPTPAGAQEPGSGLHVPSLLMGLVLGAVLFVGYLALRARTNFAVKAVLAAAAATILSLAYLGWVRRQAGLGGEAMVAPRAVLEDARRAAEALDEHHRRSQEMIEAIDKRPKSNVLP